MNYESINTSYNSGAKHGKLLMAILLIVIRFRQDHPYGGFRDGLHAQTMTSTLDGLQGLLARKVDGLFRFAFVSPH